MTLNVISNVIDYIYKVIVIYSITFEFLVFRAILMDNNIFVLIISWLSSIHCVSVVLSIKSLVYNFR